LIEQGANREKTNKFDLPDRLSQKKNNVTLAKNTKKKGTKDGKKK
jgi:hypothetical protein